MNLALSILIRIVVSVPIIIVAFIFGWGLVLMLGDGTKYAHLYIFLYFITFLPFFILLFCPVKKLLKPPLIMKIWMIWVIGSSIFFYSELNETTRKLAKMRAPRPKIENSKVCFSTKNMKSYEGNRVICVYNSRNRWKRLNAGDTRCTTYHKSIGELDLRVNISDNSNCGLHADESILRTSSYKVAFKPEETTNLLIIADFLENNAKIIQP